MNVLQRTATQPKKKTTETKYNKIIGAIFFFRFENFKKKKMIEPDIRALSAILVAQVRCPSHQPIDD